MSDDDRLLHHEYDGIQEYDNPLPFWWSGVFVLTIVFSIGYWIWFHGPGPGKSETAQFEEKWATFEAWRAEAEAKAVVHVTPELLDQLAQDPAALDVGRRVYLQNCVGCHMDDGRGQVGPNLTDDFQIHGIGPIDIYTTIRDGVPAKGMISWGTTLKSRDMAAVAAYVSTMRGQNVPGKPPEGTKVSRVR